MASPAYLWLSLLKGEFIMSLCNIKSTTEQWNWEEKVQGEFPCYKAIRLDERAEFSNPTEPKLKRGRTYEAKYCPEQRSTLTYLPGFHAFLNKKDAIGYIKKSIIKLKVVKFWANSKDIIVIGEHYDYPYGECVCVRRITRK